MSIVSPTVLAQTEQEFSVQLQLASSLSKRIQIDLMDGEFAMAQSVGLDEIWWPNGVDADIHLMYQDPFKCLDQLIKLQPHMVIIHVETMIHHMHFSAELHKEGILTGLAVLPETPVANIEKIISSFDHLLIFSGNLGHFGGSADLDLLAKVSEAKEHHPDLEIGWDGGINEYNARQISEGGVDVLNVGGYIHKAEDPRNAYQILVNTLV